MSGEAVIPENPPFDKDWTFRDFRIAGLAMSIRELAEHTVAYKTLRRIELAKAEPRMKTIRKLSNDLNLTIPEVGILVENSQKEHGDDN